ncbi:MAG: AzlD domain-containing protein [Anaerolineae bacterium]|nr:AzlD domain-containing protein [Anaerolineae bacterium]
MALLIAAMVLVTFGVRYPPMALIGRWQMPPTVLGALRYVPVAVLTAITIPIMVMPEGELAFSLSNAYLIAGIVSGIIAWRTHKLLPTIVIGMVFFLLWRALF